MTFKATQVVGGWKLKAVLILKNKKDRQQSFTKVESDKNTLDFLNIHQKYVVTSLVKTSFIFSSGGGVAKTPKLQCTSMRILTQTATHAI